MGIISIANSNDSDHFSSLFWRQLDRRYQIALYSTLSHPAHVMLHAIACDDYLSLRVPLSRAGSNDSLNSLNSLNQDTSYTARVQRLSGEYQAKHRRYLVTH